MSDSIRAVEPSADVLSDADLAASSGGLSLADVGDFYVSGAKATIRVLSIGSDYSHGADAARLLDPLYSNRLSA